MYLVKRPRVRSYILTESYFDSATPLIVRFKLDSGICTDFLQVFLERSGGTASLLEHYSIGIAEGLRVMKTPGGELRGISFIIPASTLYFDLYFYPKVDYLQCSDKTIDLRLIPTADYNVANPSQLLTIKASRMLYLGNGFSLKGPNYIPFIGEKYASGEFLDLSSETGLTPSYEPIPGEYAVYDNERDPGIDILINYDPFLFPGASSTTPTVEFFPTSYNYHEGTNFSNSFVVIKRDISDATSMVRVDIRSATATNPDDFLVLSSTYITLAPGQPLVYFYLAILNDLEIEANETIVFSLSPHLNSVIGTRSLATVTIINN